MILLPAEEEATLGARPDKVRLADGRAKALLGPRAWTLSNPSISVPRGGPWSGEKQSWLHPLNSGYK